LTRIYNAPLPPCHSATLSHCEPHTLPPCHCHCHIAILPYCDSVTLPLPLPLPPCHCQVRRLAAADCAILGRGCLFWRLVSATLPLPHSHCHAATLPLSYCHAATATATATAMLPLSYSHCCLMDRCCLEQLRTADTLTL
jgi:hypothetical protein